MTVEISIHTPQYDFDDGDARRFSATELHQRALDRRPGWLAWELGLPEDHASMERIRTAIDADAHLTAELEPRELPGGRYGIVIDDLLRTRLRAALADSTANPETSP